MDQLGFTWYPQNWWTSRSFIMLDPPERYVYFEALSYMYINDKGLENDREFFGRFLRMDIPLEVWENVTKLFTLKDGFYQSETVKKRRTRADQARINGQSGGRPEGSKKTQNNPEKKPSENPNNPPYKEKRKEIKGNTTDSVGKSVVGDKAHTSPAQPLPLWAVGFRDGQPDFGTWKKYSGWITGLMETPGKLATTEAVVNACAYFWPYDLGDKLQAFRAELSRYRADELQDAIEQMRDALSDSNEKFFSDPIKFAKG